MIIENTVLNYDEIKHNLIEEEGECLIPYRCTQGKLTIGIGHNLQAQQVDKLIGRIITINDHISKAESDTIFQHDLKQTLADLSHRLHFWNNLNRVEQYVLLSMRWNLGLDGLLHFQDMLKAFEQHHIDNIIKEMKDSLWAKQVPNRCKHLISLIEKGDL